MPFQCISSQEEWIQNLNLRLGRSEHMKRIIMHAMPNLTMGGKTKGTVRCRQQCLSDPYTLNGWAS